MAHVLDQNHSKINIPMCTSIRQSLSAIGPILRSSHPARSTTLYQFDVRSNSNFSECQPILVQRRTEILSDLFWQWVPIMNFSSGSQVTPGWILVELSIVGSHKLTQRPLNDIYNYNIKWKKKTNCSILGDLCDHFSNSQTLYIFNQERLERRKKTSRGIDTCSNLYNSSKFPSLVSGKAVKLFGKRMYVGCKAQRVKRDQYDYSITLI